MYPYHLTSIATQGVPGKGSVTAFRIEYSGDGSTWIKLNENRVSTGQREPPRNTCISNLHILETALSGTAAVIKIVVKVKWLEQSPPSILSTTYVHRSDRNGDMLPSRNCNYC